jgi:hypothetical protein
MQNSQVGRVMFLLKKNVFIALVTYKISYKIIT